MGKPETVSNTNVTININVEINNTLVQVNNTAQLHCPGTPQPVYIGAPQGTDVNGVVGQISNVVGQQGKDLHAGSPAASIGAVLHQIASLLQQLIGVLNTSGYGNQSVGLGSTANSKPHGVSHQQGLSIQHVLTQIQNLLQNLQH